MLRIAVYGISKNEGAFVERFMASCAGADMVLIADTGSTDDTVQLAVEAGATVESLFVTPWRFDDARNAALARIPPEMDVCISLDMDEELQPGWREEVERLWTPGITRLRYLFDWSQGIVFHSEKVHARRGYRWRHPCHERLVPDRIEEVWGSTDFLLIKHFPDQTKPRSQYLDLLAVGVAEDPLCPRNAIYYARELSFYQRWDEAIAGCQRYLAMPDAVWLPERAYAMRIIAQCFEAKGDTAGALAWARRSTAEAPDLRDSWCAVALYAYKLARWQECYGAATTALAITDQPALYMNDPASLGFAPHDFAAISAWHLGFADKAVAHAQDALALAPEDERLAVNLAKMRAV